MAVGQRVYGSSGDDSIETEVNALQAETAALRASILIITAQLDLDAGVTDTDYAANADPVANTSVGLTRQGSGGGKGHPESIAT